MPLKEEYTKGEEYIWVDSRGIEHTYTKRPCAVAFIDENQNVLGHFSIKPNASNNDRVAVADENNITGYTHIVITHHLANDGYVGMDKEGSAFFHFDKDTLKIVRKIEIPKT
jgi:hypothetical protein